MFGEKIELAKQTVEVCRCNNCGSRMVNVDAKNLEKGDLTLLKSKGVRVSNPDTEEELCVVCEYKDTTDDTLGAAVAGFFGGFSAGQSSTHDSDSNDDSSFFGGGGFGGGFGGFGGGSFNGGGASRSF